MSNKSLDVITVVKNPGSELLLTLDSLMTIATHHSETVRWIVIDGSHTENPEFIGKIRSLEAYMHIEYTRESDDGIYSAMNKGLAKVDSDFFIFINSGDTLDLRIINVLESINSEVFSGVSSWHDSFGNIIQGARSRKPLRWLGIMPSHQAMIFPSKYKNTRYNTHWKISSDQDLKLKLWKKRELVFSNDVISSCLIGGISMQKLSLAEIFLRSRESGQIFSSHYNLMHAAFLRLAYFTNYLLRWNGKIVHK